MNKWIVYQRERFPLLQYIPMMAALSFCALSYSSHLSASPKPISWQEFMTAFLTTISFFMLLRIADEHKDFAEDSQFRPYRPVQRGLITLKELRIFGIFLVLLQIGLAFFLDTRLLKILFIAYAYFALMTVEFFVPQWLKKRHTLYLLSHMVIMPLIDMYSTAIYWLTRGLPFSLGIVVFMLSGYCDGTVVEVGRKLRAKENEEYGVDTYTQIWGAKRAMLVWIICMTVSFISTVIAAFQVHVGYQVLIILGILYCYACYISYKFAGEPTAKNAKVFEIFPGVWMLVMYLALGILPYF